jgi:hypothetical protein
MTIPSSVILLVSLAGSALAGFTAVAPGPEMSAGVIGMTLAVGVVYLIKSRKRT